MSEEVPNPTKAYLNHEFLNSREARTIRIVCEFEETVRRLRQENVKETIMVFGSARARGREQWTKEVAAAEAKIADSAATDADKEKARANLNRLKQGEWMCEAVDSVELLCERLTAWAMTYRSNPSVGGGFLATSKPRTHPIENPLAVEASPNTWAAAEGAERSAKRRRTEHGEDEQQGGQTLMICTGGGPGLMEAANRGAAKVPGAKNIGMKITLPFEQRPNPYVTPKLCFQYHYFFTRKYWMLFACRALIVAPGGFGTMDELFELLTLKETKKIKVDIPIILFGKRFWNTVMNLKAAVKYGTIRQSHYDELFFTDSVDEAYEFVTRRIVELRDAESQDS
eukprot:c18587_g1_i2.p1 GENE.c18587_g1_i2~~c18587_g1_i2.p1  ORF type:complete len:352 (-),score=75.66 c18587_g1_i2:85-1107(-)